MQVFMYHAAGCVDESARERVRESEREREREIIGNSCSFCNRLGPRSDA